MSIFATARILLPRDVDMEKWAVIACDQFTSQPDYWQRVEQTVGQAHSALRLILPEAELEEASPERIPGIHAAMRDYLERGLFQVWEDAFVYVERQLLDGSIRRGLVGALDLEQYDYREDSRAAVRATERTVLERIPPRQKIREGAALELPHVLLLCDDPADGILAPLTATRESLPQLYDFSLMEGGGRIRGWLVQGQAARETRARLAAYESVGGMRYAVGDGNHSLASAKACWEAKKKSLPAEHPARYALVELENLWDESQKIEPIHRILKGVDPQALLAQAREKIGAETGHRLCWYSGGQSGTLTLDARLGLLPVGILQEFLDAYLATHPGQIDYIHGEETLRHLARAPDSLGFLLPGIGKDQLFGGISADGVLPRKTFSMGHAQEKRYYLEAREIL